ncbi:unnamed protein product [Somion occarium]|uniref:RBR-type E3 ubiquitin transferase n=1 Tax=Somion occarium TaxID=3059160 RepID=A0ABP1D291_9APHY
MTNAETPSSSSKSHPDDARDRDLSRIVRNVLERNRQHVSSFAGRSQYSLNGGGTSACGLAALNCARVILAKEMGGLKGAELLRYMMRRETLEDVLGICQHWSSNAHLDVDDILKAPLFDHGLDLLWSDYEMPGKKEFQGLLQRLHMRVAGSAAIVITRPPEIICVLKIAVDNKDVFVTFDSHPRDTHPDGAAFIFHQSLDHAATYLGSLLRYDPHLLADSNMQWQAQLLANYSGHVFVSKRTLVEPTDLMHAVVDSSLEVLVLKAEVAELKQQNESLRADNRRLENKAADLELQTGHLLDSLRSARKSSQPLSSVTPTHVHSEPWRTNPWNASASLASTSARALRDSHSSSSVKLSSSSSGSSQSTSKSKGKLVMKTTEERDDDDVAFATRIQLEWMEEDTDKETSTPPPAKKQHTDSPPRSSKSTGKGKGKYVMRAEDELDDNDEAYATRLQIQWMQDPTEDPSIKLAIQKQSEFEEEDRRLRAQMKALQEAVPQPAVFKCGICLEEESEYMIARIEPCGHAFCRDCVRSYLQSKLGEHRFPILCPSCTADKKTSDPGTQQIGLSEDEFALFTELEMASFSILLHCRKCKNAVFVDKCEYDEEKIIVCPLPGCTHAWCKNCSVTIESGNPPHSCDGTNELNHLMTERGWKYCPGCRTPAEKVDGCNHMTCISPGCNAHFCYLCGQIIVQSVLPNEIQRALSDHYARCRMIDDIVGVREGGPPRRVNRVRWLRGAGVIH